MRCRVPGVFTFFRTRVAVFASVLCVGAGLSLGVARHGSVAAAWQMLRAPARTPLFVDSWSLADAADCARAGQDPYVVGTFDPLGRLFNYPPVWLGLRYLGVTSAAATAIGISLALMTIAAMLMLFKARSWAGMLVSFFAVACWPVLYAVERGNCDQAIFFLLVAGFFLMERLRLRWEWGTGLVALLTMLKIYPIVAAFALAKGRFGAWRVFAAGVVAGVVMVLTSGRRLTQILANTPQDTWLSYGSIPLLAALHVDAHDTAMKVLPGFVALAIGLVAAWVGWFNRDRIDGFLPRFDLESPRGCIAVAGLAIFCFTFSRGSSYCYRLMFLAGVLALLVEDLERRESLRSLWLAVGFVGLVWVTPSHALLYQLYCCGTFAVSCAWLGAGLVLEREALGEKRLRQLMRVGALTGYDAARHAPPLGRRASG